MFKNISVAEAVKLIAAADTQIVDIRDARSFAAGHIDTAQWIDNATMADFMASADLESPLLVCCYHGRSSQPAAEYFSSQGFNAVFSLEGGISAWVLTQTVVPS